MMMLMVAFTEVQRMSPAVIIGSACLVAGISIWLWRFIKTKVGGRWLGVLRIMGILLLVPFFFFLMQQLIIKVDDTGIYYRYFAGKYVEKTVPWYDVDFVEVTKFKPYYNGGSMDGITRKRHEHEFAIKGDTGLRVVFKDKTQLTLGTQKAEELKQKLNELVAAGVITSKQVTFR